MPKVEENPEYILTKKLISEFMKAWHEQMADSGIDQVRYSQLSVVALTQVAAVVGVDVGMSSAQFLAVSKANFEKAYENAPKFG